MQGVPEREGVTRAAEALSAALEAENFAGRDPYDALSAPLLRRLARGRLLRQAAIQGLKSLPLDPRAWLGVPEGQHPKALALVSSAYSRLADLEDGHRYAELAPPLAERLLERAIPHGGGLGWSYDFDVQTRWGYYPAGTPNAVVTSFVGHALLDVHGLEPDSRFQEGALAALEFARSSLVVEDAGAQFFAYYPGSRVPIHNSNLLVASLFARCGADDQASEALDFTLARQRADGSWPYGEGAGLGWVDGYHTAFVLWSLRWWNEVPRAAEALRGGLELYLDRLIDEDGAARASIGSRYPVDIHAAASAVWALSELAEDHARTRATAERVLDWTLANMRLDDGRFAFQRGRFIRNTVRYVRWNDGHMLLALAAYLRLLRGDNAAGRRGRSSS
jgi:hypothetical protein